MSWSINVSSSDREKLKKVIQAEKYMPAKLKEMLCEQVDVNRLPEPTTDAEGNEVAYAIRVASSGHHDQNYSYGDFKVELTRSL